MFDKIIAHLNRKKPKKDYGNDIPVKPIYSIEKVNDNKSGTYYMLNIDYHYISMSIFYFPDKTYTPYKVYFEKQCVFGRARQELGTYVYEDYTHSEEDVIEIIRYRLR
jgi:hypothetical protein